jgi:hypothetical protein
MEKSCIGNVPQFGPKVMLTIVWDPTEFAIVTALDSGCKSKAGYYVGEVLTQLSEW